VHAAFQEYIGGAPEEFPELYRLLSPLTHVSGRCPPTITFLGTSDRLLLADQAEELDERSRGPVSARDVPPPRTGPRLRDELGRLRRADRAREDSGVPSGH